MDRYQPIIDDWAAFQAECERTPRPTLRRNPLKAPADFAARLRTVFPDAEQAAWNEDVWRLEEDAEPGKTPLHWRGDYYVQEASAAVPVMVLDPQEDERILDMCAAPGGKTTQIAARMNDAGTVIANEKNGKRMRALHANLNRCGVTCAATTRYAGQNMPESRYDRILVDAPCSAEGNTCRDNFEPAGDDRTDSLAQVQETLLDKAAKMVVAGGTVVYSTCTFAPAENEAVVQHALEETDLRLERIDLNLPHHRGVTQFEGETFDDELAGTVRIYPHHLASGGMYVARFTG